MLDPVQNPLTIPACAMALLSLLILAAPMAPASAAARPPAQSSADTPDSPPSSVDAQAARFCRNVHFVAYSTLPPGNRRVEESITWDNAGKRYIIRGPVLAYMLDDPGVARLPSDASMPTTTFQIAIRQELSRPIDRFCEYGFQESAYCDPDGAIYYTQVYSDCDLQTLMHVVRLTPDHAGALQLIDLSFGNVSGEFGQPIDLSEDTDLRLRVRR